MTDAQRISQLEQQLLDCDNGVMTRPRDQKIDLLNELAWLLSDTDLKRAYALAETAYTLANADQGDEQPYPIGLAYSLRTQGFLNMRFDHYPLALTQLLQALPLVETLSSKIMARKVASGSGNGWSSTFTWVSLGTVKCAPSIR